MQMRAVHDVSGYRRFNSDHRHPLWWGILGLIAIEATVFATFIVSYYYLRMGPPDWPPAGLEPPPLTYETINVFLLLASAVAIGWAGRRMRRDDRRGLIAGIGVSLTLALAVLVLRWLQFGELDFGAGDHAYGSIVWVVSGLHFLHVVATFVGTAAIWALGLVGYWTRERQLGVVVDTMYWYFVALVWVPAYLVLYWTERLI